MKLRVVGFALLCGGSLAVRAEPEHDRIQAERAAANALLAEKERECATRFLVAPCVEAAREENRTTLAQLRQQELQLDDARRRAAADARRKAIAEKADVQQARASEPPATEAPRVRIRREPQPSTVRHEPEVRMPSLPGIGASGADRATVERRNQEKFDVKAREAQAHRDTVERRNAARAAQGKPVAPLPLPASAPR